MKLLLTLVILTASLNIFAHGEDKLGPNGGYLKMPGNFHTEVVSDKTGKLKVYLLDINFKNPTVKDSNVAAFITNTVKKYVKCKAKKDYFLCDTAKSDLTNGTLTITAERSKTKGADAVYQLPLALAKGEAEMKGEDHGSHH